MLRVSATATKSWRSTRSKRIGLSSWRRHCERSEAIHLAAGRKSGLLRYARNGGNTAFVHSEGCLRNLQIVPPAPIGQCPDMFDSLLILIAAAFLLAGFIKGVI